MDDDDSFESPFDEGQWVWNNDRNELEFLKENVSQAASVVTVLHHLGKSKFTSPDLLEQLKFRKHYQRPYEGANDVVTLQDVIDITLFTAPSMLLNKRLVHFLHLPSTHRFLRALIFYCQYFIQITDNLHQREMGHKIRTPSSDLIELQFSENAADLRLLVAKEYSSMTLGGEGLGRFHHMGAAKLISLTKKDAVLYESLFLISAHIVWIALGGSKREDEIEEEIHRLFKTDAFNLAAHKYQSKRSSEDRSKTLGPCLRRDRLLNMTSPLMNEVHCPRDIDPRLLGLGVVKYRNLCPRLKYLKNVLVLPEHKLHYANVTLGILGVQRKQFDPMLKEVKKERHGTSSIMSLKRSHHSHSHASLASHGQKKQEPQIVIPAKQVAPNLEATRPGELYPPRKINENQKKKWIAGVQRKHKCKVTST